MIKEDFIFGFNRLVAAFSTTKPDEKATIYYDELKNTQKEVWFNSVHYAVRNEQKFPTIATLLSIINSKIENKNIEKEECTFCNGYGMTIIDNEAYRGNCEHGQKLSQRIKQAPASHRCGKRKIDDEEILTMITKDPIKFGKGLMFIKKLMEKQRPEMYSRVRQLTIDVLGKEGIKKLKEWEMTEITKQI